MGCAAAQREIDEVADADGERDKAERSCGPSFRLMSNACDRPESGDEAERTELLEQRMGTNRAPDGYGAELCHPGRLNRDQYGYDGRDRRCGS